MTACEVCSIDVNEAGDTRDLKDVRNTMLNIAVAFLAETQKREQTKQ